MAETSPTPESGESPSAMSTEATSALLNRSMEKYRQELGENLEEAQRRYGFTLFHSLKSQEKIDHLRRLGFGPHDGIDHYNLGCVDASQANFEQAAAHFEKAVAEQPDWFEALHNLALALERAGQADKARRQWRRCLEVAPESEREAIETHLSGLG